jgi:hypothetical protein
MHRRYNNMETLEQYLINKAWEWRRNGKFDDLETAKLIIRGKIDV